MAAYSNKKKVKQTEKPIGRTIAQGGDPEQYYSENPSWNFFNIDKEQWAFTKEHVGDVFWDEILPKMQGFESQTWNEILLRNKKQNHSIVLDDLNKTAKDRLAERYIEAESIISLRLTATHRLYGYMSGKTFVILWYDDNHGDNNTCVCRSHKKNT